MVRVRRREGNDILLHDARSVKKMGSLINLKGLKFEPHVILCLF